MRAPLLASQAAPRLCARHTHVQSSSLVSAWRTGVAIVLRGAAAARPHTLARRQFRQPYFTPVGASQWHAKPMRAGATREVVDEGGATLRVAATLKSHRRTNSHCSWECGGAGQGAARCRE